MGSQVPYMKDEMYTCKAEWKIENVWHGAHIHKCIISKFIVEYYHTTEHLEDRLEGLPELKVSFDSDLTHFTWNSMGVCET